MTVNNETSTQTADLVERLAAHLATEHGYEDNMSPGHQWPEHADDDGYRGGGYVRLIPKDVQEHRRDDARRIIAFLGIGASI